MFVSLLLNFKNKFMLRTGTGTVTQNRNLIITNETKHVLFLFVFGIQKLNVCIGLSLWFFSFFFVAEKFPFFSRFSRRVRTRRLHSYESRPPANRFNDPSVRCQSRVNFKGKISFTNTFLFERNGRTHFNWSDNGSAAQRIAV